MNIIELIQNHQLADAITQCKNVVRDKPTDIATRSTLCQLYCFQGDWKRADTQLATIAQQDAEMAVGVGLLRQLMRGEDAREQFFSQGAIPELVADPTPAIEALLQAMIVFREGLESDSARSELKKHVADIHSNIPVVKGTVNGEPFEYARDLDDLLSGFMEILTTNGKYFLIPFESIASLTFRAPERLQDRIWRSANLEVHGGMTGEIYVPTRYCRSLHASEENVAESIMMGGETNWVPLFDDGPVTGQGLKMIALGDNAYTVMELESFTTQAPADQPGAADALATPSDSPSAESDS